MRVWGGLLVAELLESVDLVGEWEPGADGDLEVAECLHPVAAARGVNVPRRDAQLLAAMRLYGTPVPLRSRGAVVLVDGERAGVSAGQAGVIEAEGGALVLTPWDEVRHTGGWVPLGVVTMGGGHVAR